MYLKIKLKCGEFAVLVPGEQMRQSGGVGICAVVSCVLEAPRAPAIAMATGRKGLGTAFD